MTIDKVNEIVSDVENKSNKDLSDCLNFLGEEFEKTKSLIIDLTRHMDSVENMYNKVNNELGKRKIK